MDSKEIKELEYSLKLREIELYKIECCNRLLFGEPKTELQTELLKNQMRKWIKEYEDELEKLKN